MRKAVASSPADHAYEIFKNFLRNADLFTCDSPKLSEADTRSKFIDPIFKDILGWSEVEIRREKHAAEGYADYILGSDFAHILIEAKRSKPRFRLNVPSKARKLQLSGPHLLGQRVVKPLLEQVKNYAIDLGAQFAILTNGSQLIVFKPYLPGRSWTSGIALAWHDYEDIRSDFAFFFSLLSREQVIAGALLEAFEAEEGVTTPLFTPIDYVQNPDRELVRNRFWNNIASVLSPLLSDKPEDKAAQDEVIRHCYVATPLSDQADQNLDQLIRDTLPNYLTNAGVIDVKPGEHSAFSFRLEKDVKASSPGTYILTGGVGSGKTTFLKRFAATVGGSFVEHYCIWLHIDFLPIGNVAPNLVDKELQSFTFATIRRHLETLYPAYMPSSGDDVRELFSKEIETYRMTKLFDLSPDSGEWKRQVGDLMDELYRNDEHFIFAILARLRGRGLRPVVVLDNTDQLGENFQERVFLFAQRLTGENQVLCIVALREEKFFAAYRRGIFDAYGDRRFHIGSPDLGTVIRKRLDFGRRKFRDLIRSESPNLTDADLHRIDALLSTLINSTTRGNSNVVRMLACVSNGDMRHALDMFREFVSSGNTNIDKILAIGPGYIVAFHEFAKSAILGSRRYYRGSVSNIMNLFVRSEARGASHLAACRALARLSTAQGVPSSHGEGFVGTPKLLLEYRESFGVADDFMVWGGELLRRGLIESEPPRQTELRATDALRITAAGAYYWRYLVRSFAYLDLVFVDTPLGDRATARRLADMAESTELQDRIQRVRLFLDFLEEAERNELQASARRSGPYLGALMKEIREQVEKEVRFIRKKRG